MRWFPRLARSVKILCDDFDTLGGINSAGQLMFALLGLHKLWPH